ncbi:MAG: NAD-dependent DNA ligase LigA, partial [Clostridia bacterium]|nr:NAD-dependent DNA ligase LigA [Clostridia bacterium]
MNKKERIKELVEQLNKASKAYYQDAVEIMPNVEYDALYDELLSLEEETGIILSNSPSQNVGYEILSELPKEEHPSRMLSLDKTKEREELKSWLKDKEGLLSWKLDGLTIVLTYEDGALIKALTRGNGVIGEVVTPQAKVFANVPHKIPFKGKLVLRGEAIITYSDFDKINEEIPELDAKYKNPRNLCSGSVRQLNTEITASRNVRFIAFSMVSAQDKDFKTRLEQMEFLAEQGFDTVENHLVNSDTILERIEAYA